MSATSVIYISAVIGALIGTFTAIWWMYRCRHDWEPVVERELPSRAEELVKNGEDLKTWRLPAQLTPIAQKTFFAIVSCKKCGAIKDYTIRT